MKAAVLYIRVSTEEQAKLGFSIETQMNTCLEFAQREGYFIVKTFIEEGLSAKDLNRPEAQNLLKYCDRESNNVSAVIVWRLDRLSRFNVDYHGTIRPILMARNIRLLSATEFNSDTIEGEYMRNLMMCNAEYELSLIRFRTKENMKTIAQRGTMPCKAPIGYRNVRDAQGKGAIVVDEELAPYVKRAFELYATGMYSYRTLAEYLYSEGFRNQKTGEKFPARKFEWMLKNQFYIGRFTWGGELYEGTHTPLITKDLFYRVQDMFRDIDRSKKHDIAFAYTGLIKCAECGCYLTAQFKRGKSKKGHYIYYSCSNSKGKHKKLKYYREEYFDNTFANLLETIHLQKEHMERLRFLASDYLKEFCDYEKKSSEEIRKQIDVLSKRIKNSYIDKLEGRLPAFMSEEEFNKMHMEWQQEKDRLHSKLNEANISSKFIYNRMDMILRFSEHLPEIFLKGTVEEKKLIITTMTKSIKFDGKNVIIDLKDTFKALQNVKKTAEKTLKNSNLRTLETHSTKATEGILKTDYVNGAGNGVLLETFEMLKNVATSNEYQFIESTLIKLIA